MKSKLTIFVALFLSVKLFAGGFDPYKVDPKFEKELAPLLSTIDSVGAVAYVAVLPTFTKLSAKYPREWRGYYWEALANIRKAELDSIGDKDQLLDEAERLIVRAEMFIKQNPELYLLRAWMLKLRIDVDPNLREPKYLTDFNWYLNEAYRIDQGNPRYQYLKGLWSESDTSDAGKKATFRYYKSAKLLFQDRPQGKYIADPDWGRGETDLALGLLVPANFNVEDPTGELAGALADSLKAANKLEEQPKEVLKVEEVPKEMIGAELPESLDDEEAGTIKITDKGAVYSEGKLKEKGSKKSKKNEASDKDESSDVDKSADKKTKKKFRLFGKKDKAVEPAEESKVTISKPDDSDSSIETDTKDKKSKVKKDKPASKKSKKKSTPK